MVEQYVEHRKWRVVAALLGASAVTLGAFGSHGLRNYVSSAQLATWRTAVEYQMFQSIALLALAVNAHDLARWRWSMRLWTSGILLFSGSLYALVLSGLPGLGIVTPIGGLCFIAGWLCLVCFHARRDSASSGQSVGQPSGLR
jgi:uncharacterized membrane protein YgdD (TMEM256/DUF423 family)